MQIGLQLQKIFGSVYNHTDASGEQCFMELALFALAMLSLPLSNADEERAFSPVNIIKSKLRNRMCNATLSGIMHVRYALKPKGICCKDFQPSDCMLRKFNESMYHDNAPAELSSASNTDLHGSLIELLYIFVITYDLWILFGITQPVFLYFVYWWCICSFNQY